MTWFVLRKIFCFSFEYKLGEIYLEDVYIIKHIEEFCLETGEHLQRILLFSIQNKICCLFFVQISKSVNSP